METARWHGVKVSVHRFEGEGRTQNEGVYLCTCITRIGRERRCHALVQETRVGHS